MARAGGGIVEEVGWIGKLWIPFLGAREIPQVYLDSPNDSGAKTVRSAIKPAPSPFDAATD